MKKGEGKKLISLLFFICIIVFVGIYGGYQVGSDNQYAKTHMAKRGFAGTYQIGEPKTKYLTILEEKDKQNNAFYYFTNDEKYLDEGTYEIVNKNYLVLKNKEDKIVFTVLYSDNNYWIIDCTINETYKIEKATSVPVTPN